MQKIPLQECIRRLAARGAKLPPSNLDLDNNNNQTLEPRSQRRSSYSLRNNNLDLDCERRKIKRIWDFVDSNPEMLTARGWGVFKESLFRYCYDFGYGLVVKQVNITIQRPYIEKKDRYFNTLCSQLYDQYGILKPSTKKAGGNL